MRILLIALSVFAWTAAAYAQDEIRVGATLGLSGNVHSYGEWVRRGAEIVRTQVNAQGGIHGRPLRIEYDDNQGEPAKAVSAFKRFSEVEHISFVLTHLSSVALAIAPLANRSRVLQMDLSASTPLYSSPDDFTFRSGVIATQLASTAAQRIARGFKIDRIAMLTIENEYGQGMADVFRQNYQGTIAAAETFKAGASDFAAELLRIKRAAPQALWVVGHLRETGFLVRQMRALGIRLPIYSDAFGVEGDDFHAAAAGAGEGIVYFGPDFNSQNSVAAEFISAYRARYGEEPTFYAAQAYDGVLALSEALKRCVEPSAPCARNKLMELDLPGATGRIKFDRNGDISKVIVSTRVGR